MASVSYTHLVRVLNMHTIKPIDEEAIMSAVMDTRRIITVEDHTVMGLSLIHIYSRWSAARYRYLPNNLLL